MLAPDGEARFELIVRRSRFIAHASGARTRAEAENTIRYRREEHPGATHVVYAFSYGDGANRQFGMSDDGEPKGTAGRPVLEILRGSDITDCVITVVRYFGGTKLGTGGLVRAYGEAAKNCLHRLKTIVRWDTRAGHLTYPYEIHDQMKRELLHANVEIISEAFADLVRVDLEIAVGDVERVIDIVRDVSRGTIGLVLEDRSGV